MKTRITSWCKNANNEKFLLALELIPDTNKVKCIQFKDEDITDSFIEDLNSKWKNHEEIELPAHTIQETELKVDTIIPEGLTPDKESDISVKVNEWNFIVLSSKLYQSYKSELDELKDRIERTDTFDKGIWESLKGFWAKVQDQLREKNLFREHGNMLKEITNELFSKLKELRTKMDKEFNLESGKNKQSLYTELDEIDTKIADGKRLQSVFDELKRIQQKLKNLKLNKEDRSKVWERIDKAFKEVKEKKFGSAGSPGGASALERLEKRYKGLIEAIKKMENSINRDKSDLEYQNNRNRNFVNQLEAQINIAKIAMIEERIRSKSEKLAEMNKTRVELEKKKSFLDNQEQKKAEEEKVKQAKAEIKERIANQIEENNKEEDSKLQQLADTIKEGAEKLKEVAEKVEDKLEEVADKVEDKLEELAEKAEEKKDQIEDKLEDIAEKAMDKAKDIASKVKSGVEDTIDKLKEDSSETDKE
jgi:chromosome segregation ATPase